MKKKIFILTIFLFFFLLTVLVDTTPTYADLAPMNEHSVNTCIKINNIESFPEIYLVRKVTKDITGGSDEYTPITQNECIKHNYKFDKFSLWFGKVGTEENLQLISDTLSPNNEWVRMNDFLLEQTIVYSLVKLDNNKYDVVKVNKKVYPSAYLQYIIPLLITILIELIAVFIMIMILRIRDLGITRILKTVILVNILTFTPFWLLTSSAGMHIAALVTVSEILITLIEAFSYYKFFHANKIKSLTLSLVANGLSAASGILMYVFASWLFL